MTDTIDEVDNLEARLSAALERLATAHVPEQPVTLQPVRGQGHGWLAVAAAVVAVVAGLAVLVTTRDDAARIDAPDSIAATPVSIPPALTVPATEPDAPIGASTVPGTFPPPTAVSAPTTAPTEQLVAIVDPSVAPHPAYVPGRIDAFLRSPVPSTVHGVRRGTDDEIVGAFRWSVTPEWQAIASVPSPGRSVMELPDGREAERLVAGNTVTYQVPDGSAMLVASITMSDENVLLDWLATNAAAPAAATELPVGYAPIPDVSSTMTVNYLPIDPFGDAAEASSTNPPADGPWAAVTTTRYDGAVEVVDHLATRLDTVTLQPATRDGVTIATDAGGGRFAVWQVSADTVAELQAPNDLLDAYIDALTTVYTDDPALTPIAYVAGDSALFVEEERLTRITLGETSWGRFAYTEYTNGNGELCSGYHSLEMGGRTGCGVPAITEAPLCSINTRWNGTWLAHATVIGSDDAEFEVTIAGSPAEANVERGVASDGSVWSFASIEGSLPDDETTSLDVTFSVDGQLCTRDSLVSVPPSAGV